MIFPVVPFARFCAGTERRSMIELPIELSVKFSEYKAVAGMVFGKIKSLSKLNESGPLAGAGRGVGGDDGVLTRDSVGVVSPLVSELSKSNIDGSPLP